MHSPSGGAPEVHVDVGPVLIGALRSLRQRQPAVHRPLRLVVRAKADYCLFLKY
jgi:hypothetical protein